MTTIAQLIAQSLCDLGVRTVYGLPGGEVVEVLDAMRDAGIEFVLVKNESSAIYMADVYARLRATIGVAITTLGPGASNAYAGLAHAYLDRSPVLLISAQTDPQLVGTHTHQVLDLQACFRPITKFTAELDIESGSETIQFALSQLTKGRPGPVHLGLCNRVAAHPAETVSIKRDSKPQPDVMAHASAIREILTGSQRPAIVVGPGLEPERPYQELQALAETLGAPVVDTPKSKGAISADHPLFAGTIGLTKLDPAYEILDEADCILTIGFDVVELVKPWSQDATQIWIAPWSNHDPYLPVQHEYVGEIAPLLRILADANPVNDRGETRVASYRQQRASEPQRGASAGRITPQDALQVIRRHTSDDIVITTDVGSHKIFMALNWQARTPNRYFVSNGLSAMGFGVPAAIAAAQLTKEPAICITGDGGLAMVIGELSLAVDADLPVIVVVMNDSALDLIRTAQKRYQKPVFGTTFSNPDYALVAQGYGFKYYRVDSVSSCESAILSALEDRKPCLIDIQIDPSAYPTAVNR